jgi:hypothetical protein
MGFYVIAKYMFEIIQSKRNCNFSGEFKLFHMDLCMD